MTLERLRTFVRVAQGGSLSAVAREQGIGQSSVTRHLRDLEVALGVSLLTRTTRRVALTEEGGRFLTDALTILAQVERAVDDVSTARGAMTGSIRLSCTTALGVRHVTRIVSAFQKRHPGTVIDLSLTDERIDLVRAGVDIAIRLGPVDPSSMKLRAVGVSRRILVAAPAYLAHRGSPASVSDLEGHQGIRLSNIVGGDMLELFDQAGRRSSVAFDGSLRLDNGLAVREALRADHGYAAAHIWLIDDLLSSGQLQRILVDYEARSVPLSLLIAPGRQAVARVRALIDCLANGLLGLPGVERSGSR